MSCISVKGVPECGFHGECIQVDNETDICRCDAGWSQTKEFSIYFVEEENLSLCLLNSGVLNSFYVLVIFLAVVDTLVQLYICKSYKQVKKRAPWFCYSFTVCVIASYRLVNPEAYFGIDFAFTFLFSISWTFALVQGYVLLIKYLKYMAKKLPIDISVNRRMHGMIAQKVFLCVVLVCNAAAQFFWISTVDVFISDVRASLALIKTAFWINIFRSFYQCSYVHITFSVLVSDMRSLVSPVNDRRSGKIFIDNTLVIWINKRIPEVIGMKRRLMASAGVDGLFFVFGLSWDYGLMLWIYLLPLSYLVLYLWSLAGVIDKWEWRWTTDRHLTTSNRTSDRTKVSYDTAAQPDIPSTAVSASAGNPKSFSKVETTEAN